MEIGLIVLVFKLQGKDAVFHASTKSEELY